MDYLAHFDRERIPERVVHAKGAGALGYFEVTSPEASKYCRAKFLNAVGKRTPVAVRFSTVGGESGSADTARDPRGFAVKFYTEEGESSFGRGQERTMSWLLRVLIFLFKVGSTPKVT